MEAKRPPHQRRETRSPTLSTSGSRQRPRRFTGRVGAALAADQRNVLGDGSAFGHHRGHRRPLRVRHRRAL